MGNLSSAYFNIRNRPSFASKSMVSFALLHIFVAASAFIGAAIASKLPEISERGGPSHTEENGYYLYTFTDGDAQAAFSNGPRGVYQLQWRGNSGGVVFGKGWNPGSNR